MSPETQSDKVMEDSLEIEWPDDYILKTKFIRSKAQAMTDDIEVVSIVLPLVCIYYIPRSLYY